MPARSAYCLSEDFTVSPASGWLPALCPSRTRMPCADSEHGGASGGAEVTPRTSPQSARGGVHQCYTPPEVGTIMSRVLAPEPGMIVYDPCCGSGGLLVKLETATEEKAGAKKPVPLKLFGQDKLPQGRQFGRAMRARRVRLRGKQPKQYIPETWAMANMNMIIHDMEGQIEIGDTFKNPKFRDKGGKLRTFDRVVATARRGSAFSNAKPLSRASRREDNPMWNQDWFTEADYDSDTAMRDSASLKPEGKPQSVPEGQDKLDGFPAGAFSTGSA